MQQYASRRLRQWGAMSRVDRRTRGDLPVCRQDPHVPRPVRLPELGEQAREVERLAAERQRAIPPRPLAGVPVPGQLDAIEVRIVEVDRLVGPVIGRPIDGPAAIEQAFERRGQVLTGRVIDGEVVQAGGAGGGGRPVLALPRVEGDVVVVAARREEGRAAKVDEQVEAQHVTIEADGTVQVGDLEVDVPDAGLGGNGCVCHGSVTSVTSWSNNWYTAVTPLDRALLLFAARLRADGRIRTDDRPFTKRTLSGHTACRLVSKDAIGRTIDA